MKKAVVRSTVFEPLTSRGPQPYPPGGDFDELRNDAGRAGPREPVLVYDFNKQSGNNFKVYYSLQAPASCRSVSRHDAGYWRMGV